MNEWNIQSRSRACSACEQPFADRQTYHTVLSEAGAGFQRRDVCEPCWRREFDPAARERAGFISQWQGVYEAPPPPVEIIPKESAESLLRKLVERNDPALAPAAFILAAMLERKRLLKVKEQVRRDGRRLFIYEQPKTGDLFTIADPELHLTRLEAVQRDVARLLEHGFSPAAGAGDGPPPPALPPTEPEPAAASGGAARDRIPAA